jgi:hypothetical protein
MARINSRKPAKKSPSSASKYKRTSKKVKVQTRKGEVTKTVYKNKLTGQEYIRKVVKRNGKRKSIYVRV